MQIDWVLAALLLAVVIVIGLAIAIDGGRRGGSFPFVTWIGATVATLAVGIVAAFVIGVSIGVVVGVANGGVVGLLLAAATIIGAPIGWALYFRHRAHAAVRR